MLRYIHYKDSHGCQPAQLEDINDKNPDYYNIVVYDRTLFTYYVSAKLDTTCTQLRTVHFAKHCRASLDKRIHLRKYA